MRPPRIILVAVSALALAGCRRSATCSSTASAVLELRDAMGALELSVHQPRSSWTSIAPWLELCDGGQHLVGRFSMIDDPAGLLAVDAADRPLVRLSFPRGPAHNATLVRGDPGEALRLHEENRLLRVLDPHGVPLGQVGFQGERAVTFDGGGTPRAFVEATPTRRLLRAPDGTLLHDVVGVAGDRAAAAFALTALSLPERLAVSRLLER